jgi:hypothetical protein
VTQEGRKKEGEEGRKSVRQICHILVVEKM